MIKRNWKNYYLPFLTNFLICLGVVISLGITYNDSSTAYARASLAVAPIWITDVLALVCIYFSFSYFYQNVYIKRFHVPKKYFILVFVAFGLSLLAVVWNACMSLGFCFFHTGLQDGELIPAKEISTKRLLLWICVGIDGGIWLITNPLSWYGCSVIELKFQEKLTKAEKEKNKDQKKEKEDESTDKKSSPSASAGLGSFV